MTVLGVDFDSNKMVWISVGKNDLGELEPVASGRMTLDETRSPAALSAFMEALMEVIKAQSPKSICVKAKPENGQMRAGSPALKMEAILLAVCRCEVSFVTPQKIKKVESRDGLKVYQQDAWKAVAVIHGPME